MISYVPTHPAGRETGVFSRWDRQKCNPRRRSIMEQTLTDLFDGIDIVATSGTMGRTVSCLTTDSRRAMPGCLFFALPGQQTDGSFYIEEAVDRGAATIVSEQVRRAHAGVTFIQVRDARVAMAQVSRRFFGYPDQSLNLYGVTGSHGKTTTVHLIKHLLDASGGRAGMTGSISCDLGSRLVPSFRTTPESVELVGMMAQMKKAGLRDAVVEIDARGIRQQNVHGLDFGVIAFLNLTEDTGREEGSEEAAYAAIRRMFDREAGVLPRKAVIPLDSPWGRKLLEDLPEGVSAVTFGTSPEADVRASGIHVDCRGTRMRLTWPGGSSKVTLPLVGEHNARHFLAAVATCCAAGRNPGTFGKAMRSFPGVPGRMERIDEGQPYGVFVDHAHTETTLGNGLDALKEAGCGRVLAVFGCGGNRDRSRRAFMVKTVQERADFAWATADNPRGESLERIFDDMKKGVVEPAKIDFVNDRREAIRLALDTAREGDCVLLAGKGHESFQEMGDTLLPFDDRMVARELLSIRTTGDV